MARLLSLPLTVSPAGNYVSVQQGSTEYYRQQIATLISTTPNEREMNEEFGVSDMAFNGFNRSEFSTQMMQYLPEITNYTVDTSLVNDTTQSVRIDFDLSRETS